MRPPNSIDNAFASGQRGISTSSLPCDSAERAFRLPNVAKLRPPRVSGNTANIAARFICSAGFQPGIFLFFGIYRPASAAAGAWPHPEYRRKPAFCSAGVPAGSFPVAPQMSPFTEPSLQSHQRTVGASAAADCARCSIDNHRSEKRISTKEGNAVRKCTNIAKYSWRRLVRRVLV
jgi:hypothetical protein